jgi:hypothetical protein
MRVSFSVYFQPGIGFMTAASGINHPFTDRPPAPDSHSIEYTNSIESPWEMPFGKTEILPVPACSWRFWLKLCGR